MDLSNATWRTSRRSGSSGGNCVEVADNLVAAVYVRDTKDGAAGPVLAFSRDAWRTFVTHVAARG